MRKYSRFFGIVLLTIFGAMWAATSYTASELASAYSGTTRISGPLQLDISFSNPISTPGDSVTLTLEVQNREQVTYAPEILVQLPPQLRLETNVVPSGMILNVQTNELIWSPVVPANGGTSLQSVPLRVETADIAQPEQLVTIRLTPNVTQLTLAETDNVAYREAILPIWIGIPPQVDQLLGQSQVAVGQPVQLMADTSGSGPMTLVWDLGDGRRVEVAEPMIVYPAAGIYDVTVEVTNPLHTTTSHHTINVVPHPAAQFAADDFTILAGQPLSFENQSGGYMPLRFLWNFGDGQSSTEMHPTHVYEFAGTYQVQLIVENEFGRSEAFASVVVGAPPPVEIVLNDSVPAGQNIIGFATSNEVIDTFLWDMGDGRHYEGVQVAHVYRMPGDYYVTLMASNAYGATQVGRWVHVDSGILFAYVPLFKQLESDLVVAPVPLVGASPLNLEAVALDEPFVLQPSETPLGNTPTEELFAYINQVRRGFSLPPLNFVHELNVAAQYHADDMANYAYTAHSGSDGSTPSERLLYFGYDDGYAGEATAWGFQNPYEAVEFWINSDAHRRIILNRYATDLGVGYRVDYDAPNVWYWTAEFGNAYGEKTVPAIRLQGPSATLGTLNSELVAYSWNWPLPLTDGQQFTVYLQADPAEAVLLPLGSVSEPVLDTRYQVETAVYPTTPLTGTMSWQVRLHDDAARVVAASEWRPIGVEHDPLIIIPTPTITPTAVITAPILPTLTPTPTPTATPVPPTVTPQPTLPRLDVATPIATRPPDSNE